MFETFTPRSHLQFAIILHKTADGPDMTLFASERHLTCDFQQCGILTSVDSDEPLQPP